MRTLGIIGNPLGHSFSKGYFEQKYGVRYLNFELPAIDDLPDMLARNRELEGFNVTIPYKKEVVRFIDHLSPEAQQIGAVNCVKIVGGELWGYNTDAYGFEVGLRSLLGDGFFSDLPASPSARPVGGRGRAESLRAMVLGTGGASAAVCYVLRSRGIDFRTVSRPQYDELTPLVVNSHKLIVNTTPLGMSPRVGEKPPIPYGAIGSGHYLYDLIYNPPLTAFLAEGKWRGARTLNGRSMLEAQAERNWEIWNSASQMKKASR